MSGTANEAAAEAPERLTPTRYASRKFLLALFVVLSATGLVAFDKIEGTIYSAVIMAALAVYSTANVAQKATAKASA